jgi:hypothetical protein
MDAGTKQLLRKAIRAAIKAQNLRVLFSCADCALYSGGVCLFDETKAIQVAKVQPTQLPECFTFDPMDSAFAGCLLIMDGLKIDYHTAEHGWATIVGRLIAHADIYGYIMGLNQENLNRYG